MPCISHLPCLYSWAGIASPSPKPLWVKSYSKTALTSPSKSPSEELGTRGGGRWVAGSGKGAKPQETRTWSTRHRPGSVQVRKRRRHVLPRQETAQKLRMPCGGLRSSSGLFVYFVFPSSPPLSSLSKRKPLGQERKDFSLICAPICRSPTPMRNSPCSNLREMRPRLREDPAQVPEFEL